MDPTVRRYIFRILLLHLAFLVAVAAVIAAAGTALFNTARADTESDALERVSVPANQTKLLLERHFQGIFETLSLADRAMSAGVRTPGLLDTPPGQELWSQLNGRVSAIVEIRAPDLEVTGLRANPEPITSVAGAGEGDPDPGESDDPTRRGVPQPLRSSLRTEAQARGMVLEAREWLEQAAREGRPAVSGVFWVRGTSDTGRPYNTPVVLAALPLPSSGAATRPADGSTRPAAQLILVGVVPVGYLEENFLFPASPPERNGMLLFDSQARLVAGGGESLAGMSVSDLVPKHLPPALGDFIYATVAGGSSDLRREFEGRVDLGTITFNSALGTARSVRATDRPGTRVTQTPEASDEPSAVAAQPPAERELLTPQSGDFAEPASTSPDSTRGGQAPMWLVALVNREAVVAPLEQTVRTAVLWAGAMVVAVTAILVSTAVQLIRARSHLERLRTEMIDREMRDARQIQLMWLPDNEIRHTPTRNIEIAAHNVPASHISGDFYNYFDLEDGRTAVVIGDVTGHGMAAAFLMATTQLLVRTTLQRLGDPGRTLEEVNDQLCMQAFHGQFVTIGVLVINTRTRELQAASAGHPPPLTRGPSGGWQALDIDPQLVLGVMEGSKYPTQVIPLAGLETLVMYTDGIIEVKNPAGDRFSLEQLLAQMDQRITTPIDSAREVVEQTFDIVRDFTRDAPQDDDLTLLAVHLSPRTAQQGKREPQGGPESNEVVRQRPTFSS